MPPFGLPRPSRAAILDAAGVAVLVSAPAWSFVSAAAAGGDALPVAALLLAGGIALCVGRLVGRLSRWIVPGAVAAVAAAIATSTPGLLSRSPLEGALGYANAAGALFVQAAIACLMVAACVRNSVIRGAAVAAALGFAIVPFVRGSIAAAAVVTVLPAGAAVARAIAGTRVAIVACAVVVVGVVGVTAVLGATFDPGDLGRSQTVGRDSGFGNPAGLASGAPILPNGSPSLGGGASGSAPPSRAPGRRFRALRAPHDAGGMIERLLSERRLLLWYEALVLLRDHPWFGVGPGRFSQESPTAVRDRDARWAHDEFLQQGAEQGGIGLALLLLLFLWGFARLTIAPSPDLFTLLGAVSLAALGVLASVDYILHFAAVPLACAALVGAAQASARIARPAPRGDHELELVRA